MYSMFNKYFFLTSGTSLVYQLTQKYIPVAHVLVRINRSAEHSALIVGLSITYRKHHSALQLQICLLNKSKGGNINADALTSHRESGVVAERDKYRAV
jgi:ribosomal protein L35AE/L33A